MGRGSEEGLEELGEEADRTGLTLRSTGPRNASGGHLHALPPRRHTLRFAWLKMFNCI